MALPKLSEDTIATLEARLDPGMPAVNPLDAWSAGGPDAHSIMEDCLSAMMSDTNGSGAGSLAGSCRFPFCRMSWFCWLNRDLGIRTDALEALSACGHSLKTAPPLSHMAADCFLEGWRLRRSSGFLLLLTRLRVSRIPVSGSLRGYP